MDTARTKIGSLTEKEVGKKAKIFGWVNTIREHGKLIFLDVRDLTGMVQCVTFIKNDTFENAKKLTRESCVSIEGTVGLRPKGTENKDIPTGKVELQIEKLKIFNLCPALPFDLENQQTNEEVRLKYRYLDLRRPSMQKNLIARAKVARVMREYLNEKEFIEFETPMLVKSTPGGARNFLVPSRIEAGKFWALPESPQLFKQLLMVAGMEKYYQIAKCLRDEDLRKDRQPEFTQLDIEMSFITQEDIITLIEGLLKKLWKDVLGVEIKTPFKRMTYEESMKKYGNDHPDLRSETREEFAFAWVLDFPLFEVQDKQLVSKHHPFTMPNEEDFKKNPEKARSLAYDIVLNGVEIGGGSIRIHNNDIQQKVFELLRVSKEEQKKKFEFLLNALSFGAPPHGGIAIGIDRLMQIMLKTESIREVIAFPKNSEGREAMLEAPAEVTEPQLRDIFIKVDYPKKAEKTGKESKKPAAKTKK